MNFHLALRQRLLDAAPVSAIVGDRIAWLDRPEGTRLPAITLQIISDLRPQHLKGREGARLTRVQCDCWATTYAEAYALAMACIETIVRPATIDDKKFGAAQVNGPRDLSEQLRSGITVYRQMVDINIWHVGD